MIFADTSFVFALASTKDPDHARVLDVYRRLAETHPREALITSNHVVFESITLARRAVGHAAAVALGEDLYAEERIRIHWATPEEEREALAYLRRFEDKRYSAVDCLSFVLMEKLGISQALTLDSDFTHRFVAIPGPRR